MAWRIHESVVRGEIDNRERGIVRGKLWVNGLNDLVVLELKGNACADLAGCILTFENPGKTIPLRKDGQMAPLQRGTIGDLTASRKVRVFDIPFEEAYTKLKKKEPVPEHTANSLYLEWFSEFNGRVVVESSDFKLTISPPVWRLTPEEEQRRQEEAAQGFTGFMQKVSDALAAQKHEVPEDKEWDEFDYEKFMRECDARTDKYSELLDKYMDHPDRDQIIAKEMGWTWLEEALEAETDDKEESAGSDADFSPAGGESDIAGESEEGEETPFDFPGADPKLPEPDPMTEGIDWVRGKDGYVSHPLSMRALEGSLALWHKCDELGVSKLEDEDLASLIGEYQTTAAKLAGALDGLAYGRDLREGAFIVAYLKRALNYLHAAQGALERVATRKLLPGETIASTRKELFILREEILHLMQEFRGQP